MHYKKYIHDIVRAFNESIEIYCHENQLTDYKLESIYKKKDLKAIQATIQYDHYKIIYKLTIHSLLSQVNHILEAYISYFDGISYPIHHVIGYYHIEASEIFVFPCVSNPITMQLCMQILIKNIEKYIPEILKYNPVYLYQDYRKDVCQYFDIDEDDYDLFIHQSFIDSCQLIELDKAYFEYLMMNYDSSLKLYSKKKKLSFYETVIVNIMKRDIKHEEMPYSIQYHLSFYDKKGVIKTELKDFVSFIVSTIILTLGWGLFFYVFHLSLTKILIPYDLYIQLDFIYLFIVFFVLAILSSYYKRYSFYNLLFKKDYNNYIERDYLQNSSFMNRMMDYLVYISSFVGLVFVVLFSNSYVAFGSDGIINNLSLFNLHGDYYAYEDIYIEHYQDQLNGYDELIGEETYVIKGQEFSIDLYEYIDINQAKESIVSHLINKGVKINELDVYPFE